MKFPDNFNPRGSRESWLPKVHKKARTMKEYMDWVMSHAMDRVFDELAKSVIQLEKFPSENLMLKRCICVLLAVEAVCRQESLVQLRPGQDNEAEIAEGASIVMEMATQSATVFGNEPFKKQDFWKTLIKMLCVTWGGFAFTLRETGGATLQADKLYAVQIRRIRDSSGSAAQSN